MKNHSKVLPLLALGALLGTAGGLARAQGFALEGAVIDSRSSRSLGVVSEHGDLASVFRAQKAMTFGILRSAGISLEQLPPEVRSRIERFQTTNVEAFRAFSEGLDLKDQGKFAEARELFRRAAELDPGFALASEQQRSMPDVNLGGSIQIRSVMAAAAGAAVDRGKASFVVDVARAMAAIQAGQAVVVVTATPTEQVQRNGTAVDYTSNPAGSGAQFSPNLVAGLSYEYTPAGGTTNGIANVNEWKIDKYRAVQGVLESVGAAGGFLAQRGAATLANQGSTALADGTTVYWGSWLSAPGASASIAVGNAAQTTLTASTSPVLGRVDYMMGDATKQMPATPDTLTFTPGGGMLAGASGSITVKIADQSVTLNNLGFSIGNLNFSGLNGSTKYSTSIASGAFSGNYSSGSCSGCVGFVPGSSAYGGNFVGRDANGLIFSTIMVSADGTASGVHLFKRP